jgi:hypothetical protein
VERGVSVVFWSRLSYDFDLRLSPEDCIRSATSKLEPGEIVVFHDSLKAQERMLPALEALLVLGGVEGWGFEALG